MSATKFQKRAFGLHFQLLYKLLFQMLKQISLSGFLKRSFALGYAMGWVGAPKEVYPHPRTCRPDLI